MSLLAKNSNTRLNIPSVGIFDEQVDRVWLIPTANEGSHEMIQAKLQKANPDFGKQILPKKDKALTEEQNKFNAALHLPYEKYINIHRSGPYNLGQCETNMDSPTRKLDIHNFALNILGADLFVISDLKP
jgi:hypothetical protein